MTEDRLRVLAVTNLWPENGSFRGIFVEEQVKALRALGHTVDVEVVAQQRGKLDYLLAARRVRGRASAYDVVHFHYGLTALAAPCIGRVPAVLSLYGSDVNVPWQRKISRFGAAHTASHIYVSERLMETMGDPDGHVIPMGVDLELFRPMTRQAARAALGIDPDKRVVLFGGDPANQVKGYDLFQAVLARVGDASELLLPGQPRHLVPLKFAAADVLLFTSQRGSEGSPGVVKEATAMDLPVVSVDVGDVSQTLAGVTPSAVVDYGPDLVDNLAKHCSQILRSRERSNGSASAGRFDWRTIAQNIEGVYGQVVA
jgi:glycosyltransferase involved in cell wall biosynthesis